jgi:hypothetical protein
VSVSFAGSFRKRDPSAILPSAWDLRRFPIDIDTPPSESPDVRCQAIASSRRIARTLSQTGFHECGCAGGEPFVIARTALSNFHRLVNSHRTVRGEFSKPEFVFAVSPEEPKFHLAQFSRLTPFSFVLFSWFERLKLSNGPSKWVCNSPCCHEAVFNSSRRNGCFSCGG